MALQSSGAISLSEIANEIGVATSTSLRNLSSCAGKTAPDSFSEFYGYSNVGPSIGVGGTESTYSSGGTTYKLHAFTTSGTFCVNCSGTIEYLVVGGGGGTGADNRAMGGGGAGGFLEGSTSVSAGNVFAITVGGGGKGGLVSNNTSLRLPCRGGDSSIGALVVACGGGATGWATDQNSGGSGGGAAVFNSGVNQAGCGIVGQGCGGGIGGLQRRSGGGGGASQTGFTCNVNYRGGDGGDGRISCITGTAVYYAGGGGGGAGSGFGIGGLGGGGNGSTNQVTAANDGTPNTGGGAGGGWRYPSTRGCAGQGGSGVVYIRYAI